VAGSSIVEGSSQLPNPLSSSSLSTLFYSSGYSPQSPKPPKPLSLSYLAFSSLASTSLVGYSSKLPKPSFSLDSYWIDGLALLTLFSVLLSKMGSSTF